MRIQPITITAGVVGLISLILPWLGADILGYSVTVSGATMFDAWSRIDMPSGFIGIIGAILILMFVIGSILALVGSILLLASPIGGLLPPRRSVEGFAKGWDAVFFSLGALALFYGGGLGFLGGLILLGVTFFFGFGLVLVYPHIGSILAIVAAFVVGAYGDRFTIGTPGAFQRPLASPTGGTSSPPVQNTNPTPEILQTAPDPPVQGLVYRAPPFDPMAAAPSCPRCGKPVAWVPRHMRWFCRAENVYPWG